MAFIKILVEEAWHKTLKLFQGLTILFILFTSTVL